MTRLVPVLDFLHELRSSGATVDYASLLERPQEFWGKLPLDAKKSLMGTEAAAADEVTQVRIVKKRARDPSIENVFLRLDWGHAIARPRHRAGSEAEEGDVPTHGLGFVPLLPSTDDESEEDSVEGLFVPQGVPVERNWAKGGRRVVELLDSVWKGIPYDVARDGAPCAFNPAPGLEEIERYWVEEPFALVSILRDEEGALTYHIEEPRLTPEQRTVALKINQRLRDLVILEETEVADRAGYLAERVLSLARKLGKKDDRSGAYKVAYYVIRNYLGFGRLDVVMRDTRIEDISCNGPGMPIFVAHATHRNLPTTLTFHEAELDTFTIKLGQLGGKLLSVAQPLINATLPDGSRIQACLGREVSNHGSAFTIRKFREDPLTAVDLIRGGAHTVDTMAFLWMIVEMKRSLIVMGSTASGKTTTMNCLSQFIPPREKVITIEDTREITLQHENWLAAVTRETFSGNPADRISMYDLLRAALRQRPEYLIVGEIRGEEGLTLFQAMSTGHTCFSTMHAGSVENAVHRLETPPISVPRVMLTSLDFFLLQGQVDLGGRPARRMLSLTELNGIEPASRNLRTNDIFRWDGSQDVHEMVGSSHVVDHGRTRLGWTRSRVEEEFTARRRVLQTLVQRNDRHYTHVARAVRRFYIDRGTESRAVPVLSPSEESSKEPGGGKQETAAKGQDVEARAAAPGVAGAKT